MLLTRSQKEQLVAEMGESLNRSKAVVFINFTGLRVKEIQDLKRKLKEKGIGFQIVKNSLFKIALHGQKLAVEPALLDQPLAVVWGSKDEVAPAKLVFEFAKTIESLKVVGGILNKNFADQNIIKQLALLPTRPQLYAQLVGSLNAPMLRLVNALQGNLRNLVYVLKQYQESKG